jgi:predicted DNA-binding transcriptional regulator AlpA
MEQADAIRDESLLTPEETAKVLSVAEQTLAVWRCTKRVDLPYIKLGKKSIRYRKSDIERFLTDNTVRMDASQE